MTAMTEDEKREFLEKFWRAGDTRGNQVLRNIIDARENEGAVSDDWRQIETAPMDGTSILGAHQGWETLRMVRYVDGKWRHAQDNNLFFDPTHWMPLPCPP